jgi:hypothetical protein
MLRVTSNADENIAKRIADQTIANYKKGLAIKQQETAPTDSTSPDLNVVNTDSQTPIKKGNNTYSMPKQTPIQQAKTLKSVSLVKEFIQTSHLLDNEINMMVSQMKLNNADEFYNGGALTPMRGRNHVPDTEDEGDDEDEGDYEDDEGEDEDEGDEDEGDDDFEEDEYDDEPMLTEDEFRALTFAQMEQYLKEHNIPILQRRNNAKGNMHKINKLEKQDLINSYINDNKVSNSLSNKPVFSNNIDINNFSSEMLLTIKKIQTIIITATTQAQSLRDNKFYGAKSTDITNLKSLYEEMDKKLYILTSSSKISVQIKKLDNDFEKLFSIVTSGLAMFVPMTGGMISSNLNKQKPGYYSINKKHNNPHSIQLHQL